MILKGGLFLFTLTGFESRATVDIDFLLRQIPGSVEEIISFSENDAMLAKWRQFLRRTKLPIIEFSEVTDLLNIFLGGIWHAIVNEDEWNKAWQSQTKTWQIEGIETNNE